MTRAPQLRQQIEAALAGRIPAALSPRPRTAAELVSCGLPEADALLGGGLPVGTIAELTGTASSGRTTFALSTLAGLTRQGHACACVDPCDALDPLSAAACGVDLRRLLWVRILRRSALRPVASRSASPLEQGLRATDLLLNAGGFRAILFDLAGLAHEQLRRIPLATWYRFRLQAEKSRTLLLLLTGKAPECAAPDADGDALGLASPDRPQSYAQSCAAVSLNFSPAQPEWRRATPHSPALLAGVRYRLQMQRGRVVDSVRKTLPQAQAEKNAADWTSAAAWTA
jgi:hypothetical protein